MKKLLLLANSSSGLYDFRNELVLELLNEFDVYISVPDEKKTKQLKDEGCHIYHTDINRRGMNPIQDYKLLRIYRRMMKELKPDIVLTYTIKPNVYGGLCAKRLHIPYIVNITGLGTTFERGGLVKKLVVFLYKISVNKARCIFYQNLNNKRVLEENGICGLASKVIPGSGVNLEKHLPAPYPYHDKPYFLFVGRMMKEKGIDEFLSNAKKYSGKAEFGIIGNYEEDYKEQIQKMESDGQIHFFGYRDNVDYYYGISDAVIVPSYHEGMSNVVLEASANARPVLATNICGCKEGIEDGVSGILFKEKDTGALSDAINKFLCMSYEECAKMGQKARQKMEKEFDRSNVTSAYMEVIHGIL